MIMFQDVQSASWRYWCFWQDYRFDSFIYSYNDAGLHGSRCLACGVYTAITASRLSWVLVPSYVATYEYLPILKGKRANDYEGSKDEHLTSSF